MTEFFKDFGITDLLTATREFQQQRIDGRIMELQAQAYVNGIPARSGNPNASSNPASQTEAVSWLRRNGVVIAVVAVAGLVAWKVLR